MVPPATTPPVPAYVLQAGAAPIAPSPAHPAPGGTPAPNAASATIGGRVTLLKGRATALQDGQEPAVKKSAPLGPLDCSVTSCAAVPTMSPATL